MAAFGEQLAQLQQGGVGGNDVERAVAVRERRVEAGLDEALAHGDGPLYVVPTYTALLELRELLTKRGQVKAYWA